MQSYIEDIEDFRNIGNYSHILLIRIQDELDNDMKNQIIEKINNVSILYDLNGGLNVSISNARITWNKLVTGIPNELKFYTDVNGMFGDVAVKEHTKLLLNDILNFINEKYHKNIKLSFQITKPLTHKIILL
jgi:hypothetical protein